MLARRESDDRLAPRADAERQPTGCGTLDRIEQLGDRRGLEHEPGGAQFVDELLARPRVAGGDRHHPVRQGVEAAALGSVPLLGALVFAAAQAKAAGVYGLVQPQHIGGGTGVAAQLLGALGGGSCGIPIREEGGAGDH